MKSSISNGNMSRWHPLAKEDILVWIIEDNDDYRRAIEKLVNSAPGMACVKAVATCEDALGLLEEEAPPDAILLDLGMPAGLMKGLDAIPRLKGISPRTPIIVLTISTVDEDIFQAIMNGASGYLNKDDKYTDLTREILSVVKGGATMNSLIAKKVFDYFRKLNAPPQDYGITKRETEVLGLLVDGLAMKQIADRLFIAYATVDSHLKNIREKLHVTNQRELVARAIKERLVRPG